MSADVSTQSSPSGSLEGEMNSIGISNGIYSKSGGAKGDSSDTVVATQTTTTTPGVSEEGGSTITTASLLLSLPIAAGSGPIVASGSEFTSSSDEVNLKFLIPNNMVGSVIGKGGATIKDISQKTITKIHIGQNDDPVSMERLVTITGSPEGISEAQYCMIAKMQEEVWLENYSENSRTTPLKDRMAFLPFKMLVPSNTIGRLIGRGGYNLKKLIAESDAFIMCGKEDEAIAARYNGDRLITIIGSIEKQRKAQELISNQVRSMVDVYPTNNNTYNIDHVQEYAYYDPNLLYPYSTNAIPRYSLDPSTSPVLLPIRQDANFYRPIPPTMPPAVARPQPTTMPSLMATGSPSFMIHAQQPSVYHPPYHRTMVNLAQTTHHPMVMEMITIRIPKKFSSVCIGRSGNVLSLVSKMTGAFLRVPKLEETSSDPVERQLLVTGSLDVLSRVQSILFGKMMGVDPSFADFKVEVSIPRSLFYRVSAQVMYITEKTGTALTLNHNPNQRQRSTSQDISSASPTASSPIFVDEPTTLDPIVCITGPLENNLTAQQIVRDIAYFGQPMLNTPIIQSAPPTMAKDNL